MTSPLNIFILSVFISKVMDKVSDALLLLVCNFCSLLVQLMFVTPYLPSHFCLCRMNMNVFHQQTGRVARIRDNCR